MEQDKQLTELGVLSSIPDSGAEIYVRDGNEPIDVNKDKRLDLNVVQSQLDGKAPAVHTHVKADITDFAHTHPISDVVDLQTTLDSKANTVHTHTLSDITDSNTIRQVPAGGTTGQVVTKTASGYDWVDAAAGGGITKGTTAERPASPTEGDLYLDTQTNQLLVWNGFAWQELANYIVETFNVEYLVIAGGGAGAWGGGGGGAGGYRTNRSGAASGGGASAEPSLILNTLTNYSITVGAGGTGVLSDPTIAPNGSSSIFHTITAIGGGGGASSNSIINNNGLTGGSGGGVGSRTSTVYSATGGAGTVNQGYEAGNATSMTVFAGTGGGGAGGVSANISGAGNSQGGVGLANDITGSLVRRGGGGAGGVNTLLSGIDGGGANTPNGTGAVGDSDATPNTGGGGGSASRNSSNQIIRSGNGGSGVVILRYPNNYTITGGTGLTFSTATDGTDKVTTFTAGSGTIQFTV